MKKVNRTMNLILMLILAASLLAGCGGTAQTSATTAAAATIAGTTAAASAAGTTAAGSSAANADAGSYIAASVNIANGDPTSFTPIRQTGNGKNPLNEIYESLMDQEGFGDKTYGDLAKDWSWNGNDLVVNLYDNITDSAGNRITASDVIFSYQTSWDNGIQKSCYLTFCTGADAVGDTQVAFHFKPEFKDTYNSEFTLLTGQYIFSRKSWEASADQMATKPVGTGPYNVKEFVPGAYAVLERRADYWQTDASLVGPQHEANVQTITYKFISDNAQLITALKTGEIDYLDNVSSDNLPAFQNNPAYTVTNSFTHNLFGMLPNCLSTRPMSDINLRAAIFNAINVDDVISAVGGTDFARKLYTYGVPGASLYNPAWETADNYYTKKTANLDVAKDFLSKSGYKGETLKIVYNAGQFTSYFEPMCLIIGNACDQLGIKYSINSLTDDLFHEMQNAAEKGDWDIMVMNNGSDGTFMKFVQNDFNTNAFKGGIGNYNDSDLDKMFAALYSNSGATQENMDAFIKYITDKYYAYGFIEPVTYTVFKTDLIKSADVRTYRSWVIPGSWQYVQK